MQQQPNNLNFKTVVPPPNNLTNQQQRCLYCSCCGTTFSLPNNNEQNNSNTNISCPNCQPQQQQMTATQQTNFQTSRRMIQRVYNCKACCAQFKALATFVDSIVAQEEVQCIRCQSFQTHLAYQSIQVERQALRSRANNNNNTTQNTMSQAYQQQQSQSTQNQSENSISDHNYQRNNQNNSFSSFQNQNNNATQPIFRFMFNNQSDSDEHNKQKQAGTDLEFIKNLPEADDIQNKQCYICLEDLSSKKNDSQFVTSKLPCGHCFDRQCLEKWLYEHNSCPVCRIELPKIQKVKSSNQNDQQQQQQQRFSFNFGSIDQMPSVWSFGFQRGGFF